MGLSGCSELKKELKAKHASALPNVNSADRPNIRVDIVAVDMELVFFMIMSCVHSLVGLHNVGVQMLDYFTKTYLPKELVFMYETRGVPLVKSIEQERRDRRHTDPKTDDANKASGTDFLQMVARLSNGHNGGSPLDVCDEIIATLVALRGSEVMIPEKDAERLLSGTAMDDEHEFAARLFAYVATNMTFTRAELTENVVSIIADRLDLFSYESDAEIAALADLLCPEYAHLGTDEVLRKMFEKLLATRTVRSKVRFFVASRILHATTDIRFNSIWMIGAPYVRYQPDDDFTFGRMHASLKKYRPSDVSTVESGRPWKDGDMCERFVRYSPGGGIVASGLSTKRVSADMPGEGEAKALVVAQRRPGKSIVVMSRDSDTLITLLLGINQNEVSTRGDTARAFGTIYLDMGTTQIDPVPFLVNATELHRDILARAQLESTKFEFPIETFCLRHMLTGCDYFSNPYGLGPAAFSEGFHVLGPMLSSVVQRVCDPEASLHLPWVQVDEELLWAFVRILYAADVSMATRMVQKPGYNAKKISQLAKRTQRGIGLLACIETARGNGVSGKRLADLLLESLPSHAEVVRESEEHKISSLERKHRRAGDPAPVMQHNIILETYWTEAQVRAFVRRLYWTINYFNGASRKQNFDPLAKHHGRSIWGWSVDPESKKVVLDDCVINPVEMSTISGTPALALL